MLMTVAKPVPAVACGRRVKPRMDMVPAEPELDAREVELEPGRGAYLTEEVQEGSPRPARAVVLLPDATGFRGPIRRFADRLAIFCFALVLVPDLYRGDTWSSQPIPSDDYATWLSGLPPQRVEGDLYDWTIYLRADHQVRPVVLAGTGLGAELVLRALGSEARDLQFAAGVAIAARHVRRKELTRLRAPVLLLFDKHAGELAEQARAALDAPVAAPMATTSVASPDAPSAQKEGAAAIESVAVESISKLRRFRVAELRERLAALGASTEGKKDELIARLRDIASSAVSPPPASPLPPPSQPAVAPPAPMVLEFAGLSRSWEQPDEMDGVAGGAGEPSGGDDGDDGLIMAEAWTNLHLDSAAAACAAARAAAGHT